MRSIHAILSPRRERIAFFAKKSCLCCFFVHTRGIRALGGERFPRSREWGKEIPAFAGMAVFFVFADNTELGGTRKYKKPPFRRKFILANAGTEISFADSPQSGDNLRLRRRRFLPSQEWDGLFSLDFAGTAAARYSSCGRGVRILRTPASSGGETTPACSIASIRRAARL
ncbi:MAG: hypothetical protein ACR2QC_09375 [Gammaproteobacteria bacterium]